MNHLKRLLTNICTEDLIASKQFYTSLFNFEVAFESDWFINLQSAYKTLEIGLIDPKSEVSPVKEGNNTQGLYLTFVVDNADEVFDTAKKENLSILKEPHDTFYGQRRLLLQDPNGTVIDVSSVIV